MKLLDLFCGAGGAAMGYHFAGFDEIVGVDINPQKNYPFRFIQGDALEYLKAHGREFDAVHASPPCQRWTKAQKINRNDHPDLLSPLRPLLKELGKPYVIENVVGAPLIDPVELCGAMFGLRTYRHRLFECSFRVNSPAHPPHLAPQAKMGRPVADGYFIQVVGNFSDVKLARSAMEMSWATRDELREAIPPAYTRFIGKILLEHLRSDK